MAKGYTMWFEPNLIGPLLNDTKHWEFVVAVYYWLIEELYKELGDTLTDVELEVMRMQWLGSAFPAIGILDKPLDFDFENLLRDTSDKLLRERPISEIISFLASTGINWESEATRLMTKSINHALLHRERVWDVFRPDQPFYAEEDQSEFRRWLQVTYEYAKENLESPRNISHQHRQNLFLSAIGLLTYGFLDSVPDIVNSLPLLPKNISTRAYVINFIFPLPKGMNVFNNPDATKIWVAKNRNNLQFSEAEGIFVLTDQPQA